MVQFGGEYEVLVLNCVCWYHNITQKTPVLMGKVCEWGLHKTE